MIRVLTALLCAAAAASAADPACLTVTGSHIFGSDLAAAEPHLSALPARLEVGFPPAPRTRRVFTAEELTRIARSNGISFSPIASLCFELAMGALDPEAAIAAMQHASPAARIKIVELQKTTVPEGALIFPLTGLEPVQPDSDSRLWRGFVRYAGARREEVWARVAISGPVLSGSKQTAHVLISPDIRHGDAVRVEVECGMAHLVLNAVAVANGHTGEMVELRNPESGKTFQARLLTPATARLVLAPGQTL